MNKSQLTDKQVEQEIERLSQNPYVKLSKAYERLKYKRRQVLYTLRWHEKNGKGLENAGITMEMLKIMNDDMEGMENEEC